MTSHVTSLNAQSVWSPSLLMKLVYYLAATTCVTPVLLYVLYITVNLIIYKQYYCFSVAFRAPICVCVSVGVCALACVCMCRLVHARSHMCVCVYVFACVRVVGLSLCMKKAFFNVCVAERYIYHNDT